jgi:hypothetical protein
MDKRKEGMKSSLGSHLEQTTPICDMSGDNSLTEEELRWMDELLAECRNQSVMPSHRSIELNLFVNC